MNLVEQIKLKISKDYFTSNELDALISGTNNRRFSLVKRGLANNDLILLKRGLYCLGAKHRRKPLDLFVFANHIYGVSYISLESSLSWHGWIPEGVPVVVSCTAQRQREFANELGHFSYFTVPSRQMLADVRRVEVIFGPFFIAEPWRALMDYIYVFKKDWLGFKPLLKSLRLNEDSLEQLTYDRLAPIADRYQSRRLDRFVEAINKERI